MLVSGTDTSFAPSAILPESYNNGRTRAKKEYYYLSTVTKSVLICISTKSGILEYWSSILRPCLIEISLPKISHASIEWTDTSFSTRIIPSGSYITLASEVTSELHGLKHLTCFSRDLHQTEWNLSIRARIGETEDL